LAIIPAFDDVVKAQSGDTLQTAVAPGLTDLVNEKLSPLQEKIESMIVHADSVLISFNKVMDSKRQEALRQSIDQFSETTAALTSLTNSLSSSVNDSDGALNNTFDALARASENAAAITDSLKQAPLVNTLRMLEHSAKNLSDITSSVSAGEGTLGKLVQSDSLVNALNETNIQAQLLLQDMRLNPKRYVHFSLFGKKNKAYEKPDKSE
jgi:phospholipid/cholesterol/gamma-HCH transport system substrate-binding protein